VDGQGNALPTSQMGSDLQESLKTMLRNVSANSEVGFEFSSKTVGEGGCSYETIPEVGKKKAAITIIGTLAHLSRSYIFTPTFCVNTASWIAYEDGAEIGGEYALGKQIECTSSDLATCDIANKVASRVPVLNDMVKGIQFHAQREFAEARIEYRRALCRFEDTRADPECVDSGEPSDGPNELIDSDGQIVRVLRLLLANTYLMLAASHASDENLFAALRHARAASGERQANVDTADAASFCADRSRTGSYARAYIAEAVALTELVSRIVLYGQPTDAASEQQDIMNRCFIAAEAALLFAEKLNSVSFSPSIQAKIDYAMGKLYEVGSKKQQELKRNASPYIERAIIEYEKVITADAAGNLQVERLVALSHVKLAQFAASKNYDMALNHYLQAIRLFLHSPAQAATGYTLPEAARYTHYLADKFCSPKWTTANATRLSKYTVCTCANILAHAATSGDSADADITDRDAGCGTPQPTTVESPPSLEQP
jgi:hypothetical protein